MILNTTPSRLSAGTPKTSVCWSSLGMANASLEDCQLFSESEILQRDLFIAAKNQKDNPK